MGGTGGSGRSRGGAACGGYSVGLLIALARMLAGDVVADLFVDAIETAVPHVEEEMDPAVEPLLLFNMRLGGLELLEMERATRGEAGGFDASTSLSTREGAWPRDISVCASRAGANTSTLTPARMMRSSWVRVMTEWRAL